jgi:hypothetical protein
MKINENSNYFSNDDQDVNLEKTSCDKNDNDYESKCKDNYVLDYDDFSSDEDLETIYKTNSSPILNMNFLKNNTNINNNDKNFDSMKSINKDTKSSLMCLDNETYNNQKFQDDVDEDSKESSFVMENYKLEDNFKIKIADFGLARLSNVSQEYTCKMVTLSYRPPELLLRSQHYNEKVDIWSLGCIFVEILIGIELFTEKGEITLLNKIKELFDNDKPNFYFSTKTQCNSKIYDLIRSKNKLIDDSAIHLIEKMLVVNPIKRIDAKNGLKSDFLSKEFV